jgi:hypothetical protein
MAHLILQTIASRFKELQRFGHRSVRVRLEDMTLLVDLDVYYYRFELEPKGPLRVYRLKMATGEKGELLFDYDTARPGFDAGRVHQDLLDYLNEREQVTESFTPKFDAIRAEITKELEKVRQGILDRHYLKP